MRRFASWCVLWTFGFISARPGTSFGQQPTERRPSLVGTIDLEAPSSSSAADKDDGGDNKLLGQIEFESAQKEQKRDPYLVNQDAAIDYFEKLSQAVDALAKGEPAKLGTLSDGALLHVAAGYLYCSVKKGTCPKYLQALREIDVINAVSSGSVAKVDLSKKDGGLCPTMSRFWEVWLANDMQKRMDFQVHVSHMRMRADFAQKSLPGYLPAGCEAMVQGLASQASPAEFFKARYQPGSPERGAISEVAGMLKFFREKKVHLLQETMPGGKQSASTSASSPGKEAVSAPKTRRRGL